jgi:Na+/phosphate symporter
VGNYLDFVTFDSRAKAVLMLILGVTAGLTAMPVLAASADGGQAIDWWVMGMTLLGGLAVFLYGMEQMAEALKKVAGDSMKQILGRLTNSRIMGLITGAFVTAVIQSSSVTTVMLVGFVTAGLAAIGKPREAVRVAVAHVSFKVVGVILIFPFIPYLADLVRNLLSAANDLESIGDIIETDAVGLAEQCFASDVRISEETQQVLGGLHSTIAGSVERALQSVAKNDVVAAQEVIAMKGEVQTEVELAEQHEAERLVADAPNRIAAYSVEMEVIEKLKRIYYFAKRMAKTVEVDPVAPARQPA